MFAEIATDSTVSAASARLNEVCDSYPQWHVVYTRSHCEQLVYDQLVAKGFQLFLPKVATWSKYRGSRRVCHAPLFPSYLFLHHVVDKFSYIDVRKARGVVNVLGERWDSLAVVPDAEIEAIQTVVRSQVPVFSHPYLRAGQKVRIKRGPLTNLEGVLIQTQPDKGLLVISVELLQRSVAIKVDCTTVEAV